MINWLVVFRPTPLKNHGLSSSVGMMTFHSQLFMESLHPSSEHRLQRQNFHHDFSNDIPHEFLGEITRALLVIFHRVSWDLYLVNDGYYMVNITGFVGNILLIYGYIMMMVIIWLMMVII